MASVYWAQAREILGEAEAHAGRGVWNLVVRRCQEAVELALKALLRANGIEVPALHDVGFVLRRNRSRLPATLAGDVDRLAAVSRRLWREREPSMYGDEETGTPPTALYSEFDAREMLAAARDVMARCAPFLGEPGTAEGEGGGRQRP